jgi:hypothetical protein
LIRVMGEAEDVGLLTDVLTKIVDSVNRAS